MSKFLKVKIKSLAAESNIIKLEEQKAKATARRLVLSLNSIEDNPDVEDKGKARSEVQKYIRSQRNLLNDLQTHRIGVVRRHSRATHLAYAFLRGTPYRKVENKGDPGSYDNWSSVVKMAKSYGPHGSGTEKEIKQWYSEIPAEAKAA